MSEDINKKIRQIAEILGQDHVPDNVKSLISTLLNNNNSANTQLKPSEALLVEEKGSKGELDENIEVFRKIKKVVEKVGNNNDPRIGLLTAIRPFLNKSRQKQINHCIKLINISGLAKLVEDNEKTGF